MEGRLLSGHAVQQSAGKQEKGPGAAGGSIAGQHRLRQPIRGPGRPGSWRGSAAGAQMGVDLAGDVPLEAADDLLLGQAFLWAPGGVGAGGGAGAHPGDHDPPQGMVGLAVPARIEAVPTDLPGRGRDRRGPAQVRPGGLAAQPPGVVPGGGERQGRGVRADAVKAEQAGRAGNQGRSGSGNGPG